MSLPALLPNRKHANVGSGVLLLLTVIIFVWGLMDIQSKPSGGDGPAVMGLSVAVLSAIAPSKVIQSL